MTEMADVADVATVAVAAVDICVVAVGVDAAVYVVDVLVCVLRCGCCWH